MNAQQMIEIFDKVCNIVNEPVKLICDVLHQPLKGLDAKNERKKIELESRLQCEAKQFESDLDLKHRQSIIELDEMIANNEFRRQTQIVEAIKQYQNDLSETYVAVANSIGRMSLELRAHAYKLVDERAKEYRKIQEEANQNAMASFAELEARFPEGSRAREIMENSIGTQLANIVSNANRFICAMETDITQMANNIDQITTRAIENADKYLSPMNPKNFVSHSEAINDGRK